MQWKDCKMHFSLQMSKLLVPPHLSYFTRNHTFYPYKTRQRNNIHLPKPKLMLEKVHLDIQVQSFKTS